MIASMEADLAGRLARLEAILRRAALQAGLAPGRRRQRVSAVQASFRPGTS
jgi:hypothetical protein